MDRVTYPNAKVVGLASKFVPIKIDAGESAGGKIFEKFKCEYTPTILFLDSKGKELSRTVGFVPPDQFAKQMQAMLAKSKGK